MTFLTLLEFSKILPSLTSSLECLPTLTHLTVFPILLPTLSSPPSTLHHPLPTCLIYQQPFILFTFHFFTFFLPTLTLSCPLPPFLAKLSTLTTLSPFPFPSVHSTLLPIQLSLSYFQVLFTSSQPPFLSYLPSCPPHLISLHSFPPSYLSLLPLLALSFQFSTILPVCYLNPLLHHSFPTSSLFLPISLPHFPLIFITFSTPYQPCIPVKISDHPPFFLSLSHSLYIHMFSPCHPQYVSICKN